MCVFKCGSSLRTRESARDIRIRGDDEIEVGFLEIFLNVFFLSIQTPAENTTRNERLQKISVEKEMRTIMIFHGNTRQDVLYTDKLSASTNR